eukprot:TRINITY_DN6045_c0_g1_i1.p1 TRINITY_DN6045_c0_g1~~TRINITY_DN6045_c0_g1_i1.p1  ORF type:complete len:1130 (+),score=505.62 TRINITY_DN6045_c0_g1_i1:119-3508(+)
MAQYLSEATHQRLQLRPKPGDEDEAEEEFRQRITSHTFKGRIRSMVVATRTGPQGQPQIWTASEGDIELRNIRGETLAQIERKKDTLVNCMLAHDRYLWVGLSDGYLRVFDQRTLALVSEVKQHAGPVMCLLGVGPHVFSGGSDWQIYVWEPKDFRCIGQLSGHQNQVNCLAAEGDFIFSGGEDQAIRCWTWDPVGREGEEIIDNWPKVGHAGGIRSIVINEIFLFSASSDGALKVWNTQTGQLVKYLDQRGTDRGAQIRIVCLERDPAAQRIWAGSTDGVISVWDAQQLHRVGRLDSHSESYVKDLLMCVRLSSMKVWGVNDSGEVKVWFSDTDEDADWSADRPPTDELQAKIEQLRAQVIDNYKELEKRKQELKLIEDIDLRRKEVLAHALGRRDKTQLRREYYARMTLWLRNKREQRNRGDACKKMMMTTQYGQRLVYYRKLLLFARERRNDRRKEQLCKILMSQTDAGRQKIYWRNLQEYTHRQGIIQKKRDLAELMMRNTTRGARSVYWLRWRRLRDKAKTQKKREAVARALLSNLEKGQIAIYWQKMNEFAYNEKRRFKHISIGDHLQSNTSRGLQTIYYRKWAAYYRGRKVRRKKYLTAELLMRNTSSGLTKVFWFRWREWAAARGYASLDSDVQKRRRENDEVQRILDMQGTKTDAEIDQELLDIQREIEETQQQIRDEEQRIAQLERDVGAAKRKSAMKLTDTGDLQRILMEVMEYLRAKAIHCLFDFNDLSDCRKECAPATDKAKSLEVLKAGIKTTRSACYQQAKHHNDKLADGDPEKIPQDKLKAECFIPDIGPGGAVEWRIFDEFDHWQTKNLKKGASGIRDIVVAYDTLSATGSVDRIPEQTKGELVTNAWTMLCIIQTLFSSRRETASFRGAANTRKSKRQASGRTKAAAAPLPADGSSRRSRPQGSSKRSRSTPAAAAKRDVSPTRSDHSRSSRGSRGSRGRGRSPSQTSQPVASPAEKRRSRSAKGAAAPAPTGDRGSRSKGSRKPVSRKVIPPEEKPWLGWTVLMEDPKTGEQPDQVILHHILPGGPADEAGMQHGDVIVLFGDDIISDINSFKNAFRKYAKVGARVGVKFNRAEEGEDGEYEAVLVVQNFADKERLMRAARERGGDEGDA